MRLFRITWRRDDDPSGDYDVTDYVVAEEANDACQKVTDSKSRVDRLNGRIVSFGEMTDKYHKLVGVD